ncbi:SDR family NAD(P)-dependent oxidoreductase [Paenibacillus lutimineralis]|uniref:SDR family NAD(P)-dependent oxidoreductase n=2 Tax=Paenibacillus lutimineralis TaxID=2707005 RepID=A0A3Q9I719_9BACL|nr:SDR family NAD(P)-dependent oxidoreductase [Paenibacillus lutimineralis]
MQSIRGRSGSIVIFAIRRRMNLNMGERKGVQEMDALSDVRFSTVIKNSNYIVRDHRVHGVRIMPGVTLLDMIYRFLQSKGIVLRDIELRKILFSEPISTSEYYDKKIRISFTKRAGFYEVLAQSMRVKGDEVLSGDWDENLRCELHLHLASTAERKTIDIAAIKNESQRVEDMDYAYSYVRKIDIRHSDFMKGLGKLYYGNRRILAEITLGELAGEYLGHYYMHPCYLDAATLVQGFVVLQDLDFSQEVHASIPMFIESFRSYEPMKKQIYVYIKDEGYPDGAIKDLMYFDIEVYNAQGEEIATFKRWGLKKIRSKDLISRLKKVEPAQALLETAGAPATLLLPEVAAAPADQKEAIASYLKELISSLSGIPGAGLHEAEGFYSQGLNSQHLLEIVKRLEDRLGDSLYPTLLFEYANIEELSQYILEEYGSVFFATLDGGVEHRGDGYPSYPGTSRSDVCPSGTESAAVQAYAPVWFSSPLEAAGLVGKTEQVLVFCSSHDELYALKGTEAAECFTYVLPGERRGTVEERVYQLAFSREEDYVWLADELKRSGCMPGIIIYTLHLTVEANRLDPIFYMLRELLRRKIKMAAKVLYVYARDNATAHPGDAAMAGFLHCVQSETVKVSYKCVGLDEVSRKQKVQIVLDEAYGSWNDEHSVSYERNERMVKGYRKVGTAVQSSGESVIRSNCTYLVTGGAGGIGKLLAKYIASQGGQAILCGRAGNPPEGLHALLESYSNLEYVSCDVTDLAAVQRLHHHLKQTYGSVHGIFHCAGITRDGYLVQKDRSELDQVLRVKVEGTANLDEVFKHEPLAFFVAFSSVAGILGNPGQSDYGYANGYMDGYIYMRESLRAKGERKGQSLSVNWPLWREGGMQGGSHTEHTLRERFGITLLETEAGLGAMEWALRQQEAELLILPGDESRIDAVIAKGEAKNQPQGEASLTPQYTHELPAEDTLSANHKLPEKDSLPASPAHASITAAEALTKDDDLAIIGLSGRFPGADDLFEYWEVLKSGKDCITEIDPERWSHEEVQRIARDSWSKDASKWGGFLRDVDKFDSLLFNVAPYQAALMDPHERVFLEMAWEAFEDAGYTRSALKGRKIGVFAGAMWMQYQLYNNSRNVSTSTISSIANRVSYYFGLTGPSLGIDTMCSSSLTALHLACQSVKSGDSPMALVGGVNLSVHPDKYLLLSQGNFASSDGRCRSFGEGGDGYVPAEAAGAILIKPLGQAKRDQDRIYAVIKGSAINHGGESSGFTVPNQKAQEEAVAEAIARSGVDAATINYIEAHGTGTSLGDPIEVRALMKAYKPFSTEEFRCAIGSVKSNIGHAEAAAGISSIAKVLLQMQHGQLVPSIHSETLNPHIPFEDSGFYVQRKLEEWKPVITTASGVTTVHPLRAGISAFGAGGSNAHLILEKVDDGAAETIHGRNGAEEEGPHIFVLSAQTAERLQAYASRMMVFLGGGSNQSGKELQDALAQVKVAVADIQGIPAGHIGEDSTLGELGLGHVEFVQLCGRLEAGGQRLNALAFDGDFTMHQMASLVSGWNGQDAALSAYKGRGGHDISLRSLAYTLQTAREPMKHRMAIIYYSLDELIGELKLYLDGGASGRIFTGEGGKKADLQPQTGSYSLNHAGTLARAWTEGTAIIWKELYGAKLPLLLRLPHYPFARKRHWIEPMEHENGAVRSTTPVASAGIHPGQSKRQSPEARPASAQSDFLKAASHSYQQVESASGTSRPPMAETPGVPYTGSEVGLEYIDGNIALIRIQDSLHNNTFTHEVIQGITHCFQRVQNDERIKAIVVAGNERIFSMGGTQEQLLDISDSKLSFTDAPILYRGMLECPVPVISAMEGHASGGGMLFGLYADVVVMAEESVYSAAFAKYGFTPGMGATFILEDKLGKNLATEMMFTAKMYTGEQLKNRAASVLFRTKANVLQEAISIARLIAEKPRTTVSVLKRELSGRVLNSLQYCVERENEMHRITFTTPEVKEKILHLYRSYGQEGTERIPQTQKAAAEIREVFPSGASRAAPPLDESSGASLAQPSSPSQLAPMIPQARGVSPAEIQSEVARIIANRIQLHEDELDEGMNFKDMGVDSISGVEIVRDINESFGLQLDTIDIYDYSTIQLLSAHIINWQVSEKPGPESRVAVESNEERDLLDLLTRMNEDELDVNEVAQFLEVYL